MLFAIKLYKIMRNLALWQIIHFPDKPIFIKEK